MGTKELKKKIGFVSSFDKADILNKDQQALIKAKKLEKKFRKKMKKFFINGCVINSSVKDDFGMVNHVKNM